MLDKYLEKLGFFKGTIDSNIYLKEIENGLLIIVIFMDDIIFGGDDETSDKFVDEMKEFEMSMIGEMKYFLGSHLFNSRKYFICQTKFLKDLLKRFCLEIFCC